MRAGPGQVPTPLNALYYQQRASAGLIIGEATWICQQGYGYMNSPGIETKEQVEGHKLITKAVHDKDGLIFLQLWHVGRISHPFLQPNNQLPVAPSALAPTGQANTPQGKSWLHSNISTWETNKMALLLSLGLLLSDSCLSPVPPPPTNLACTQVLSLMLHLVH